MGDDRPSFMVVNATDLQLASAEFLGAKLSREEALASGAATEAFHIIDHLIYEDPRLKSFYLNGT